MSSPSSSVTSVGVVEALPAGASACGASCEPPTLARRFPVVPGARLYPLVPPLPVLSSLKPDHLLSAVSPAYALQADGGRARAPLGDRRGRGERVEVARTERVEQAGELRDPPLAAPLEERAAPIRRPDEHRPPVAFVRLARDEPVALECAHEAGHRRRGHLLRAREPADGRRAAEHEHGERRETGGREPALLVDPAHAAQHVDRSGMEPLGHLAGVRRTLA